MERVAYTPKEFAALFGKSQTWGYRQIWDGKVAFTKEHGRTLIPASEVSRLLGGARPQKRGEEQPEAKTTSQSPPSLRETLIRGSQTLQRKPASGAIPPRRK